MRARAKDLLEKQLDKEIIRKDKLKDELTRVKRKRAEKPTGLEAKLTSRFPKTMRRLDWIQKKAAGFEMKLKILIALYQMLQGIGGSAG